MKNPLLFILLIPFSLVAQDNGFPFGAVTRDELEMRVYDKDTTAVALVLDEFGEAFINQENLLVFEYHVKTKILRKKGLEQANITIPLFKYDFRGETLHDLEASSFSLVDGEIREHPLDRKRLFTEDVTEHVIFKRFAIPDVQVGSVIEFRYTIQSPYIFNFREWEFQRDIPKVHSLYSAVIPANYTFNMSLKGYLKLDDQESEVIRDCFDMGGGNRADCSRLTFCMDSIPAFVEEEYMTAGKNFISSIQFELAEIRYFSGARRRITKEWRDVEDELRTDKKFGIQLKRGGDIIESPVEKMIAGKSDPLKKAEAIYNFIKGHYTWNGEYSKYCEHGIKKAFENKYGNVGDINLSLIAALRHAGLDVDPLILSTREHGFATELYPVLSDFNYVIAKLTIHDQVYLLDATDEFLPFGLLPIRCLNGKGRVIGDRTTSWYDIKPPDKRRMSSYFHLVMDENGVLTGTIQNSYLGYSALERRKLIYSHDSEESYIQSFRSKLAGVHVDNFEIKNLADLREPLVEVFQIRIQAFDETLVPFLFNPFLVNKWNENPFKSSERLYPVDFGAPLDERVTLTLELPEQVRAVNIPEEVALGLPHDGGKYVLNVRYDNRKLALSSYLAISRILYTSEEYHYLKELFDRIVQAQNTDIILKKEDL